LIEATVLLVDVLFAKSSVSVLVVIPCHVVLAPMPGTSLHSLLVSFSLLRRGLLSILILLLLSLVSRVLFVLLFLVITYTRLLVSCFVVVLDFRGLLEVGSKLELTLESGNFSLHCNDIVFVW
jgi:hypothetical protein